MFKGECKKYIEKEISFDELLDNIRKYGDYFKLIECIVNNTPIESAESLFGQI